jgi:glucose-6-phosphate isomerase
VVIGIGGSYIGARAAVEFIRPSFNGAPSKGAPDIYFAGNSLSGDALARIIGLVGERDFSVNVVSKSGTTLEPAVAFRVLRDLLEKKYGKKRARSRIYVTTDPEKGALRALCGREGYESFRIPRDIGGRYSVLTAAGLLPIAASGADIRPSDGGGAGSLREALQNPDPRGNAACLYAAARRNLLYARGKTVELLAHYEPPFSPLPNGSSSFSEKARERRERGFSPPPFPFSTDLHSLGQYIRKGPRHLFRNGRLGGRGGPGRGDSPRRDGRGRARLCRGGKLSLLNRRAFEGTLRPTRTAGCLRFC